MLNRKKLSYWVMALTVLAVAALLIWPVAAHSMGPRENCLTVKTARVTKRTMEKTLALAGTVAYAQERYAIAPQTGIAAWVTPKQEGERIEKGEPLVRLDTTAQEALLSQALLDSPVANESSALTDLYQYQHKAQADQLEAAIHQSTLRAYESGQVLQALVRPGEAVQAGAPVALLSSCSQEIRALAGPQERRELEVGMAVRLESEGSFIAHGRIAQIGPLIPDDVTGLSAAQVTIAPAIPLDLSMGESLEVVTILETLSNVSTVPLEALDAQGQLWQVHEGRAWQMQASPQWLDETSAWVPGLKEDAVVVLSPAPEMLNGQRVREAAGS